jgi:hypothetical protein
MTRSQSVRLSLVATSLAIFAAAGWATFDMKRTSDECISYGGLQPLLMRLTITTEWSWTHLEARCVYRDPQTNVVVAELRPA